MPSEAEIVSLHRRVSRERLIRAMQQESATRHLPPGNKVRDKAIEEWRWAQAVCEEWE